MKKGTVIIGIVGALLLLTTGYQSLEPGTANLLGGGTTQSSVSSAHKDDPFSVLTEWAPDAGWGPLRSSLNESVVLLPSSTGQISSPAGSLLVLAMQATLNADAMQTSILSQRSIISRILDDAGWQSVSTFDADGPTGEQYGFQKITSDGTIYTTIDRHGEGCTNAKGNITCSRWIVTVSVLAKK